MNEDSEPSYAAGPGKSDVAGERSFADFERRVGLVEEYRSIREEQAVARTQRTITLAFVLAAVGTIAGFAIRDEPAEGYYFAVLGFTLLLIACASWLTRRLTQRAELLRSYLARYVEPALGTTGYNQRLQQLEQRFADDGWLRRSRWDEATIFAFAYTALAILSTLVYLFAPAGEPLWRKVLAIVVGTIVALGGLDLSLRKLASWRQNERAWQRLEEALFSPVSAPTLSAAPRGLRTLVPHARGKWAEVERELAKAASREPRREDDQQGASPRALESHVVLRALELSGVRISDLPPMPIDALEEGGVVHFSPAAARRVEALHDIGEALHGGMGAEGVRRWLARGSPSRLDRILAGDDASVVAEARSYLSSTAG